jgi:GNAT superfamily N-acetyltransferase
VPDPIVRDLRPGDAAACDEIVASLPAWFGIEEGIREAADLVRAGPGLVVEVDGRVAGFLTHAERYPSTHEVTWMAVHAERRSAGLGTALLAELEARLRRAGVLLLLVRTLSDREDPGPEYAATRGFYLARGFLPVMELDIWGPENPGQLLAKPL